MTDGIWQARFFTDTVHFTSTDPAAILPVDYKYSCDIPYTVWCADDSGHVFTFTFKTAGPVTLTVRDKDVPSITGSISFDVLPAPATSIGVAGLPATTTSGATTAVKVTLRDLYSNVATGYRGTVHLSSTDPAATLVGDRVFTAGDAGVAWLPVTFATAGSRSVTATDLGSGMHATASTTVAAAPHINFEIMNPAGIYAGYYIGGDLQAMSVANTTDPGYRGTVHFSSSDPAAILPSDYTFSAGSGGSDPYILGDVQFRTAGTQTLTATDISNATITGTVTINVKGGSVATIALKDLPTAATAGATSQVVVVVRDSFGNLAQDIKTVTFTSTDSKAILPANFTFHASDYGAHAFSLTLKTAGMQSVTAKIVGYPSITTTASTIVLPGAVGKIAVSGMPSPSQAGVTGAVTVTAQDAYGNPVRDYTGVVHFTSSDPRAVLPADYAFAGPDNGAKGFSVVLKTAGAQWVRATDTVTAATTGAQTGITVTPAAAKTLAVYGIPTTYVAGDPHSMTVKALDAYGNTATGYRGRIHVNTSDPAAGVPADYTFTAADKGVHTLSYALSPALVLKTAGVQAVRARDTATSTITGVMNGIVVGPAAAKTLVVSGIVNPYAAGTAHSVTVRAKDAYGNTATGYRGRIHVTTSDPAASVPADYTFTAADKGVHTLSYALSPALVLRTAGSQNVRARDTVTSTITGVQTGIVVH